MCYIYAEASMIKLCINGSRSFTNYDYFKRVMNRLYPPSELIYIINGGAKGADALALKWAKERNIDENLIEIIKPQWNVEDPITGEKIFDKSAGMKRNIVMNEKCDRLVSFWDGESPGTRQAIKHAHFIEKIVTIIRVDKIVFVFGSNLAGIHGKGAALYAVEAYGAKYGEGIGMHGKSYAIPTKDKQLNVLPLILIEKYINDFKHFARKHPEIVFHVTRVGCGLAGYTDRDIAPMFQDAPDNCDLPIEWI